MRVAFIKNNTVIEIHPAKAVWLMSKANLRKDWQTRILTEDLLVSTGWLYNPETEELTAPP